MRVVRRARAGAAVLEFTGVIVLFIVFVIALYWVAVMFWVGALMSSTADVATLSGQVAYQRWRVAPSAFTSPSEDAANFAEASGKAQEAAQFVVESAASSPTQAGADRSSIAWLFDDRPCAGEAVGPFWYLDRGENVSRDGDIFRFTVRLAGSPGVIEGLPGWAKPGCIAFTSRSQSVRLD